MSKEKGRALETESDRATPHGDTRPASGISKRRVAGVIVILALAILLFISWPSQYQLDTSLYRITANQTRTMLADGTAVSAGDKLTLAVTVSVPMYVYVFHEDAQGRGWALFPLIAAGQQNPLEPGVAHLLPQTGSAAPFWTVGSVGGVERIHILASPAALPNVQAGFAALPPAESGAAYPEAGGAGSPGREEALATSSAAAVVEAAREAVETADQASGVSYRVIKLVNTAG